MQEDREFILLIKRHEGLIYKITRLYADGVDSQKDLYQEIIFQLWKGYKNFRGNAKISTWMYRVALNTALMHLKKKKRRGHSVSLDDIILKQEQYDPISEERLKVLYAHIKKLGDVDRGIIFLFLEGKRYEDIGAIMGFSTTNVGTRMARIKEKLRQNIRKN